MRNLLLATTLIVPSGWAYAQSMDQGTANMIMSSQQSQVPGGECAASSPCRSQGLIPITFQQGDVVLSGSVTDSNGDVWSLAPDSCNGNGPSNWWSGVYKNGQPVVCGYTVALRNVNGTVYEEEAKGSGWQPVANDTLGQGMVGPYVTDPGKSTSPGQNTTSASPPDASTHPTQSQPTATNQPSDKAQNCPGLTVPGGVTPGTGTFQANGGTYSIDPTNGDVAAVNGQPINDGAYETSQLIQGSDGSIYGQSNAANNNGQWFQLSSDGSYWQPLTGTPTAIQPSSTTTAQSTSDPTALNRVASTVCPQLSQIEDEIAATRQREQALVAQMQALAAQQASLTPTPPPAVMPAPTDTTGGQ